MVVRLLALDGYSFLNVLNSEQDLGVQGLERRSSDAVVEEEEKVL
jgi:hypothetical protein